MKERLMPGLVGVGLGFCLSRIGFSSWDQVHAMFTFADLRLVLAFGTAVAVLAVGWALVRRFSSPAWSPRDIHKGTLPGSILFGVGWAASGACPAIALVQLGEGQLGALLTLAGIFAGNWLYSVVHARFFRFPQTSCADV